MLHKVQTVEDIQQHYRWLRHMRETQPVWLDEESGCWHVFRYKDVGRVMAEYQFFSSERKLLNEGSSLAQQTLLSLDPPEHRRYRNLVAPFFTSQALTRLSGQITAIVQELLDQVRSAGRMDLVNDFAYPLPATVIVALLGVPAADLPLFRRWSDGLTAIQRDKELLRPDEDEKELEGKRISLLREMSAYFRQVMKERRHETRDDLISALVTAEVEGEHLSEEEIVSFCIVLLRAGHVTTTRLLSSAIWCFTEHPGTLEQLRERPELMRGAIEEVLRYAPPANRIPRTARTGAQINGLTIPEGAQVFAWLSSANRDEEQFPDAERFDITRSPNRHVAFGHGIHFCVGAPLARLEASIALPMLLEQLTDLHISREQPLELTGGLSLFDFQHLPIIFAPSALS